jgi:hypothetical protein
MDHDIRVCQHCLMRIIDKENIYIYITDEAVQYQLTQLNSICVYVRMYVYIVREQQ